MSSHTVGDHVLVAADVEFTVDDGDLVGVRFTTDAGTATLVIPAEHILEGVQDVPEWDPILDYYPDGEYYETEH